MSRWAIGGLAFFVVVFTRHVEAQTPLTIVNPDFEIGGPQSIPSGWTVAPGNNPFWTGNQSLSGADPGAGYLSSQFISASWAYGGLPNASSLIGGDANSALIVQDIDLSPYSAQIGQGNNYLGVSYVFFHNDGNDLGTIQYDFLDSGGTTLAGGYSAQTSTVGWQFVENLEAAEVPISAATLRISLGGESALGRHAISRLTQSAPACSLRRRLRRRPASSTAI
jgi:hypothetical protein